MRNIVFNLLLLFGIAGGFWIEPMRPSFQFSALARASSRPTHAMMAASEAEAALDALIATLRASVRMTLCGCFPFPDPNATALTEYHHMLSDT